MGSKKQGKLNITGKSNKKISFILTDEFYQSSVETLIKIDPKFKKLRTPAKKAALSPSQKRQISLNFKKYYENYRGENFIRIKKHRNENIKKYNERKSRIKESYGQRHDFNGIFMKTPENSAKSAYFTKSGQIVLPKYTTNIGVMRESIHLIDKTVYLLDEFAYVKKLIKKYTQKKLEALFIGAVFGRGSRHGVEILLDDIDNSISNFLDSLIRIYKFSGQENLDLEDFLYAFKINYILR